MIALTIDCEEWTSALIRDIKSKENYNTLFSKEGNDNLLKVLDKHKIRATFFTTGFFTDREKEHIRKIYNKGHEVASHGYDHTFPYSKKVNLNSDVARSKKAIEKVIKSRIKGFRAPRMAFSHELIKVLDKNKFEYDSSLNPSYLPGVYHNRKYPLGIFNPVDNLKIKEIPVAAYPYFRFPMSWVFIRNIGGLWANLGSNLLLKQDIAPVLYFHSWEFKKIKSANIPIYLKYHTGKQFCKLLDNFITRFKRNKFVTMEELMRNT